MRSRRCSTPPFGPDRRQRTAYRVRAGVAPIAALSFAAFGSGGTLLGSVQCWPVAFDDAHRGRAARDGRPGRGRARGAGPRLRPRLDGGGARQRRCQWRLRADDDRPIPTIMGVFSAFRRIIRPAGHCRARSNGIACWHGPPTATPFPPARASLLPIGACSRRCDARAACNHPRHTPDRAAMLMSASSRPARLVYGPNGFRALSPGDHVLCAASGARIALDALRYWSVDLQQPYATAALAVEAITGRTPAPRA